MKNNTSKSLTFPRASYGFTLIEMLLVVGIIAVLTAVSIPMISNLLENTKIHTDEANERAAKGAAMTEYLSNGTFGNSAGGVKTTAYYDAAAGQWKSTNTGIAPYGKCETEKHTDLILGGDLSSVDGSLRLFWIKSGAADNKFARFPTHSGLTIDPPPAATFEVAPEGKIAKWNYTLDDTNNIVTLNYYTGSETEVIVYGSYPLNGKTYTTRLASNTEDATYDTPYMFNVPSNRTNCRNIKTITFSNRIDTSNVTDMSWMFYYCEKLTSLDVSGFDTSNVTTMRKMFFECHFLTTLDLSNFNTSNVTNMLAMFAGCYSLPSLDVSNFNTSNVTDMSYMFQYCNISSLNMSNFNTSNVTNMCSMFSSCSSLTTLDMSNFSTSNVDDMSFMFSGCTNLTTLKLPEKWVIKSGGTTNNMFDYCGKLSPKPPTPAPIS